MAYQVSFTAQTKKLTTILSCIENEVTNLSIIEIDDTPLPRVIVRKKKKKKPLTELQKFVLKLFTPNEALHYGAVGKAIGKSNLGSEHSANSIIQVLVGRGLIERVKDAGAGMYALT